MSMRVLPGLMTILNDLFMGMPELFKCCYKGTKLTDSYK
jgi:hypothetical protein